MSTITTRVYSLPSKTMDAPSTASLSGFDTFLPFSYAHIELDEDEQNSLSPIIFRSSTKANINERIAIAAGNLSDYSDNDFGKDLEFLVFSQTTSNNAVLGYAGIEVLDTDEVVIKLPSTLHSDSFYLVWARNRYGYSPPFGVNQPEIYWIGSEYSNVGRTAAVYGANLQYSESTTTSHVYVENTAGTSGVWATVTSVNPYKVEFTVPSLAVGDYNVWVHSGKGGAFGWSNSHNLTIIATESLSSTTVSVLTYGAVGDGVTDDTTAIDNALSATPTGDITYFPAGNYLVKYNASKLNASGFAHIHNKRLHGAGRASTKITIHDDVITLCQGSRPIQVQDITFESNQYQVPNGVLTGQVWSIFALWNGAPYSDADPYVLDYATSWTGPNNHITIQNCDFIHNKETFNSISVGANDITLQGCRFYGGSITILQGNSIFITDCDFINKFDIPITIYASGGYRGLAVEGCTQIDSDETKISGWGYSRLLTTNTNTRTTRHTYCAGNTITRGQIRNPFWTIVKTVVSSTTTTVTFDTSYTTEEMTDNIFCGRYLAVLSGTGNGQSKRIVSYNNTTKVFTIDSATPWTINPDATSVMTISFQSATCVHAVTAATTSSMTVNLAFSAVEEAFFPRRYVLILSGTGAGSNARISSYDSGTKTFTFSDALFAVAPDVTSTFTITKSRYAADIIDNNGGEQILIETNNGIFYNVASGSGTSIVLNTAGTPINQYGGVLYNQFSVAVMAGTGKGFYAHCTSYNNTTKTITLDRTLPGSLDNTSKVVFDYLSSDVVVYQNTQSGKGLEYSNNSMTYATCPVSFYGNNLNAFIDDNIFTNHPQGIQLWGFITSTNVHANYWQTIINNDCTFGRMMITTNHSISSRRGIMGTIVRNNSFTDNIGLHSYYNPDTSGLSIKAENDTDFGGSATSDTTVPFSLIVIENNTIEDIKYPISIPVQSGATKSPQRNIVFADNDLDIGSYSPTGSAGFNIGKTIQNCTFHGNTFTGLASNYSATPAARLRLPLRRVHDDETGLVGTKSMSFTIQNAGGVSHTYNISTNQIWLTTSVASILVAAESSETITLTADLTLLSYALNSAEITVTGSGEVTTYDIFIMTPDETPPSSPCDTSAITEGGMTYCDYLYIAEQYDDSLDCVDIAEDYLDSAAQVIFSMDKFNPKIDCTAVMYPPAITFPNDAALSKSCKALNDYVLVAGQFNDLDEFLVAGGMQVPAAWARLCGLVGFEISESNIE